MNLRERMVIFSLGKDSHKVWLELKRKEGEAFLGKASPQYGLNARGNKVKPSLGKASPQDDTA